MDNKSSLYHIVTLPNGLRAVVSDRAGEVSYIGVAVNAGSRDEDNDHAGLAHFVEHTIFKGTRKRKSWHISNRMESIGGELNAYTSKEETVIYTNAPAGHSERAFELLSDLINNSTFPIAEIEKEREVIIEEIHSYQDNPADSVFDEFEELAYRGCGLAHNILGTPDSVRRLGPDDAMAFVKKFYTPSDMVIYCVNNDKPERNIRLIEKFFGGMHFPSAERERKAPPALENFDETRNRDTHQANTIVGARVFGRTDPRRYALFLLNNYLGGPCMNSRLNLELRERRGLVYTVESHISLMSDTGQMIIYFGSDASTVDKCRRIITNEIDRLAQTALSPTAFAHIRDQYCGQLTVLTDHRESRAMSLAKSLLYYNQIQDIRYNEEKIREVTPDQLRDAAQLILQSGLNRLTLL